MGKSLHPCNTKAMLPREAGGKRDKFMNASVCFALKQVGVLAIGLISQLAVADGVRVKHGRAINLFPPYFAWNNNFSGQPIGWRAGTNAAPQWIASFDFLTNRLYGYPASARGWHYGWNPTGDNLFPRKLSDTAHVPCSFSYHCAGHDLHGDFAYDMFLRHDDRKATPQLEVMVWAGNNSRPIGNIISNNIIAAGGISFDLWAGTNSGAGYYVYSFAPHRKTSLLPTEGSLNADMIVFFRLLPDNEHFSMDMYLDVVEAGFEVVRGHGWVACDRFSCQAD